MKHYWFKAKKYGIGWYPVTWQGWAITIFFVAVILWNTVEVDAVSHSVSDTLTGSFVFNAIAVILLLCICWKTGEKLTWRWGDNDSTNK